MRCWYFLLVAHVRIVVAVLPITGDNCSMKRIRGKVGDSGTRAACAAQANASGAGHPRRSDDFLGKVSHSSDIVECFGQLQYLTVSLARDRATMFFRSGTHHGRLEPCLPCGAKCTQIGNRAQVCRAPPTFRRSLSLVEPSSLWTRPDRLRVTAFRGWPPANSRTRQDAERGGPTRLNTNRATISGTLPG